jgi:hypothetical protein
MAPVRWGRSSRSLARDSTARQARGGGSATRCRPHRAGHPCVQVNVPEAGGTCRCARRTLLTPEELAIKEAGLGGLCLAQ